MALRVIILVGVTYAVGSFLFSSRTAGVAFPLLLWFGLAVQENDRSIQPTTQPGGAKPLQDTRSPTPAPASGRFLALYQRGPGRAPSYPPIEPARLAFLESTLTNLDSLIRAEYQKEVLGAAPALNTDIALPLPKTHIIIHLPKTGAIPSYFIDIAHATTGGTTWGLLARRNEDLYRFKQFWYHIAKTDLPFLPRYLNGTLFGHFRYGTHLFYPNTTYSYITMLRNPVERVLSHYYYHLTEPKDPNHALAKSMSLEQWINASKNAHNRQVQFIAGLVYEEPTQETLSIAKHHIRRFGFVGITERFDDTIVLLKHYLGWTKLKYFIRKQTREKPGKDKIEPRVLDLIRQHNSLDMELYAVAVEMFNEQVAAMKRRGIDIEKEFADYKAHK